MPSQRPVFSSDPALRRLGVGGSSGGGGGDRDRTLRAQLVIAFVLLSMLLAVPLYLWRRPSSLVAGADGGMAGDAGVLRGDAGGVVRTKLATKKVEGEKMRLGPVHRVKCSRAPGARGNEGSLCDPLPSIEKAFAKAIEGNADCAPKTGKEGTINYVITLDFRTKAVNVFPGASGTWKGPQAKRAATCVRRSLAPIEWDTMSHQHRYYMIAILATYPAPEGLETVFE